jgi:hypothetical protein
MPFLESNVIESDCHALEKHIYLDKPRPPFPRVE